MGNGKMKQIVSKAVIGAFAAAACFSLLANMPVAITNVNADSGVDINSDTFPDKNFRQYVSEKCDTDHDDYLSEAEINEIKRIYVYTKHITDLTGIEYFTALKKLECEGNHLTGLDISKNTALTYLNCSDNQLTGLDISKNTVLEELYCDNNPLTSLDVSKNKKLKELYCFNNQLTSLDVSNNTDLEYFHCYSNQLTSLDISKNTALISLICYDNRLTRLDVSTNNALRYLECYDNQLKIFNIAYNSYLLGAYSEGEKSATVPLIEEIPESAVLYYYSTGEHPYPEGELIIDRSAKIFTTPLEPGWNEYDGDWIYILDDTFAIGWQKIGYNWYYFDEDGFMQTGWLADGGVWYYLQESGAMVTGWKSIGGVYYFFKSNGAMAADEYCEGYWLSKSGAWTYQAKASWKSDSKGTYYQDTNGWYPKNQWLKIDDQWYFFKNNGYMASSEYCNGYWFNQNGTWTYPNKAAWKQNANGWYYQDTSGWYAKNCDIRIDGKLYNFDARGYCTNP